MIRDQKGNWVVRFAKNLGFETNNDAELWEVKVGLELALKLGITNLLSASCPYVCCSYVE